MTAVEIIWFRWRRSQIVDLVMKSEKVGIGDGIPHRIASSFWCYVEINWEFMCKLIHPRLPELYCVRYSADARKFTGDRLGVGGM
jgi:hypothetical protein